jgi:hypothetical protein
MFAQFEKKIFFFFFSQDGKPKFQSQNENKKRNKRKIEKFQKSKSFYSFV